MGERRFRPGGELTRVAGYLREHLEEVPQTVRNLGFFGLCDFLLLVIDAVHAVEES